MSNIRSTCKQGIQPKKHTLTLFSAKKDRLFDIESQGLTGAKMRYGN